MDSHLFPALLVFLVLLALVLLAPALLPLLSLIGIRTRFGIR